MFGIAYLIIIYRITLVTDTICLRRYGKFLKHPKTFRLFFRIIRLFFKIIRMFLKIPRLGIFASSCCQCIYILLNLKKSDPYDPYGFYSCRLRVA